MQIIPAALGALSHISPRLAGDIAHSLWWKLGAPAPVRDTDREIHEKAETSELTVDGNRVVTYQWGTGPRVILLVHGWRSRASRFAPLIAALERPDRTIISFDAPGNGASGGSRTHVFHYVEAIRQLGERHGEFEAIIGHSFGVLSSFVAVRRGTPTKRIIGIAGMYNLDQLVEKFSEQANIGRRAQRRLRNRISRTFDARVWREVVAELEPTDIHVPVLLIHDEGDRQVPVGQAALIADAHTGSVDRHITEGLGHSRILSDPGVVHRVAQFVSQ